MRGINSKLVQEGGLQVRYLLFYTLPYTVDQKSKKRKLSKLTAHQRICNLIIDHEMMGFVDLDHNVYLYLRKDGVIAPLWSEQTKNYFLRTFPKGITYGFKSIRDGFSIIEGLCRDQKFRNPWFKLFDPETSLVERKKIRGAAHE